MEVRLKFVLLTRVIGGGTSKICVGARKLYASEVSREDKMGGLSTGVLGDAGSFRKVTQNEQRVRVSIRSFQPCSQLWLTRVRRHTQAAVL